MILVNSRKPEQVVVEQRIEAPSLAQTRVLVAKGPLDLGHVVQESDVDWSPWPKEGISESLLSEATQPTAKADAVGSIVRSPLLQGEPLRREKLIKGASSGFMSAILPSGKRAIAINILSSGSSTAGGFIFPNDRVDVIRTYRDELQSRSSGTDTQVAETLLTNIRVLAIGAKVEERNNEKVVTGETATLELDPKQAEQVIVAQRIGQLSLALRSIVDSGAKDTPSGKVDNDAMTIIRYGVPFQSGKR